MDGEKQSLVVSDPKVRGGRPVMAHTGITTSVVFDRWLGGELVYEISEDYGVSTESVIAAVYYELGRRHKRSGVWERIVREGV